MSEQSRLQFPIYHSEAIPEAVERADQVKDELVAKGFDAEQTEALLHGAAHIYSPELQIVQEQLAANAAITIQRLKEFWDAFYDDDMPRAQRRAAWSRKTAASTESSMALMGVFVDTRFAKQTQNIMAHPDIGMYASLYLNLLTDVNMALYSGILGDDPESSIETYVSSRLLAEDTVELDEEGRWPHTRGELTAQLERLGMIDPSKETLDARVEHFRLTAQVEASRWFLESVNYLMACGDQSGGFRLLAKHKETILGEDYDAKTAMLKDVALEFQNFGVRIGAKGRGRHLLNACSLQADAAVRHMHEWRYNFSSVYQTLGYELPPFLQQETAAADAKKARTPRKASTAPQPTTPQDEELGQAAEVAEQLNLCQERAGRFNKQWSLTAAERRRQGMDTFNRKLMQPNVESGLEPLEKSDARRAGDFLARLNEIAQVSEDAEICRQTLALWLLEEEAIHDDFALIRAVANDLKISVRSPEVAGVTAFFGELQQKWPAYRQLIVESWPNAQGVLVVDRLEMLLDQQPQVEITDEELQARELQRQIDAELDEILLPPEAKRDDVDRELRRIGLNSQATGTTRLEWDRLRGLVTLREDFNGVLYASKDTKTFGGNRYFVVVFELEGRTFAVAECPRYSNATYVVAEGETPGTWLEVLGLNKREAREVGAHRVTHRNVGEAHVAMVMDLIFELAYPE